MIMVRGLNLEARRMLADHGITATEWAQVHGGATVWGGDRCGCIDDRCIGHHHDKGEACGCLPVLIKNELETRSAGTSTVRGGC